MSRRPESYRIQIPPSCKDCDHLYKQSSSHLSFCDRDHDRPLAVVRTQAEEVAVAHAFLGLDELVAHVVAEAKRVDHVVPVRAAENEARAVLKLPGHRQGLRLRKERLAASDELSRLQRTA